MSSSPGYANGRFCQRGEHVDGHEVAGECGDTMGPFWVKWRSRSSKLAQRLGGWCWCGISREVVWWLNASLRPPADATIYGSHVPVDITPRPCTCVQGPSKTTQGLGVTRPSPHKSRSSPRMPHPRVETKEWGAAMNVKASGADAMAWSMKPPRQQVSVVSQANANKCHLVVTTMHVLRLAQRRTQ